MNEFPDSSEKVEKKFDIWNLFKMQIRTFACGLCSANNRKMWFLTSNFKERMYADIRSSIDGCLCTFPETKNRFIYSVNAYYRKQSTSICSPKARK